MEWEGGMTGKGAGFWVLVSFLGVIGRRPDDGPVRGPKHVVLVINIPPPF
jgi:hypothetical protein